jgi:hypothetical protein
MTTNIQNLFGISEVCSSFDEFTIGSKVILPDTFFEEVCEAIDRYYETGRHKADRTPGQHFLTLPKRAYHSVSCGVGVHTGNIEDYTLASHRGKVSSYLKREHALPVKGLNVVVYSHNAYCNDTQVSEEEAARMDGKRWVIVAVLATGGEPKPPAGAGRFVSNLAGGNRNYEADKLTVDGLISEAKLIEEYWGEYSVVADEPITEDPCWYCGESCTDNDLFCREFDTPLHETCLNKAIKNAEECGGDDDELNLMRKEFGR